MEKSGSKIFLIIIIIALLLGAAVLIFKPDYLVSFVSKICTLLQGDIIATGTPSGVGLR